MVTAQVTIRSCGPRWNLELRGKYHIAIAYLTLSSNSQLLPSSIAPKSVHFVVSQNVYTMRLLLAHPSKYCSSSEGSEAGPPLNGLIILAIGVSAPNPRASTSGLRAGTGEANVAGIPHHRKAVRRRKATDRRWQVILLIAACPSDKWKWFAHCITHLNMGHLRFAQGH